MPKLIKLVFHVRAAMADLTYIGLIIKFDDSRFTPSKHIKVKGRGDLKWLWSFNSSTMSQFDKSYIRLLIRI